MRQVFEEMQTLYEANLIDRYSMCYMAFIKVFTIINKLYEK